MVEQVVSRGAEVQSQNLGYPKTLLQRAVDLIHAGTVCNVTTQIPPGAFCWQRESRGIEPIGNFLVGRIDRYSGNAVRPLVRTVAVREISRFARHGDIHR